MKKLSILLAMVFVILALCGCYFVNGAELDKVVGTYKLETLVHIYSEEQTIDFIADKQAESYLVIGRNGIGYYTYKDADTQFICKQIRVALEADAENPDIYTTVKVSDNKKEVDATYGYDNGVLNYYLPAIEIGHLVREYSERVRYSRVDAAEDLTYVKTQISDSLVYAPHEMYGKTGIYSVSNTFDEVTPAQYVYYIIDFSAETMTADVYFATVGNPDEDVVKSDLPVTLSESEENRLQITLDRITYEVSGSVFALPIQYQGNTVYLYYSLFTGSAIDEEIGSKRDQYNTYISGSQQ